jgi:hypothetical protein
MVACGLGCFLGLGFVLAAVGMWETSFSPHTLHESMLDWQDCGCGATYKTHLLSQPKKTKNRSNIETEQYFLIC